MLDASMQATGGSAGEAAAWRTSGLLSGAFGALSIPVVVFDGRGRVLELSAPAEEMAADGDLFRVVGDRILTRHHADAARIEALIVASGPADPTPLSLPLRDGKGQVAATADIALLPPPWGEAGEAPDAPAAVMAITAWSQDRDLDLQARLRGQGLTPCEAEVAMHLLDGATASEIAAIRRVSLETVRSQIKSVYGKLGVERRGQFATHVLGAHDVVAKVTGNN